MPYPMRWCACVALIRSTEAAMQEEIEEGSVQYAHEDPCQYVLYKHRRGSSEPMPVCVAIHGGFWRSKYSVDNSLILPLADFFVQQGYLVVVPEVLLRMRAWAMDGRRCACDDSLAVLSNSTGGRACRTAGFQAPARTFSPRSGACPFLSFFLPYHL